jgi:hypothetical protein
MQDIVEKQAKEDLELIIKNLLLVEENIEKTEDKKNLLLMSKNEVGK